MIITQGKPMDTTLFYAVYMYQQSFNFNQAGYASAMAWVMLLLIAVITFILFKTKDSGFMNRSDRSESEKKNSTIIYHILVCGFGLLMLYPLFWMFMSSFKDTNTIFTTARSLIRILLLWKTMQMDGRDLRGYLLLPSLKILFL